MKAKWLVGAALGLGLISGCGSAHRSSTSNPTFNATEPKLITVLDKDGRTSLTVDTSSQDGGRFVLSTSAGVVSGIFGSEPWGQSLELHSAGPCLEEPAPHCSYTISGGLDLNTHSADLNINLTSPELTTFLQTAPPDTQAANAAASSILEDLKQNDLVALASMLSPGLLDNQSPEALAHSFSSEGSVHITAVATTGHGSLSWLPSGEPVWEQPISVTAETASGDQTLKVALTLDDEHGHWYAISAP